MNFGSDYMYKYSSMLWLGMKPESGGELNVTIETDKKSDYTESVVSRGMLNFTHINFADFSFKTDRRPQIERLKMKAKKLTYYKLIFTSASSVKTATATSVDIRVRYTGNVR